MIPRVECWGCGGDPRDGTGTISYWRVPVHWWILDNWLGYVHPHWQWWYAMWGRILPYWGDPFCAAYTIVWKRFYTRSEECASSVDVGWDRLPEPCRMRITADDANTGPEGISVVIPT